MELLGGLITVIATIVVMFGAHVGANRLDSKLRKIMALTNTEIMAHNTASHVYVVTARADLSAPITVTPGSNERPADDRLSRLNSVS